MSFMNKDDMLRQLKAGLQHQEEFLGSMISFREDLSAGGYNPLDIFDPAISAWQGGVAEAKSAIARLEDDEGHPI